MSVLESSYCPSSSRFSSMRSRHDKITISNDGDGPLYINYIQYNFLEKFSLIPINVKIDPNSILLSNFNRKENKIEKNDVVNLYLADKKKKEWDYVLANWINNEQRFPARINLTV